MDERTWRARVGPISCAILLAGTLACGGGDTAAPDATDAEDRGTEADSGADADADGDADADVGPDADADGDVPVDGTPGTPFTFAVFGDLNGGDCGKNARVRRVVAQIAATGPAFAVQTGDLIEGYGSTSCFGHEPAGSGCVLPDEGGNVAEQLAPLLARAPPAGLAASFFPVIGNHDGNWSEWYPDPCGGGICDLLGMDSAGVVATWLTHGTTLDAPGFPRHALFHGDICALAEDASGHPRDFYYSFAYRNSLFLVLAQYDDYSGMLSCNTYPGHDSCESYCSDPALREDAARIDSCYYVEQFDWLTHELERTDGAYAHRFVFLHAPLLSSGDSHGATGGADVFRALLEAHGIDAVFNGHNHAYERTHAVRGAALDPTGTVYVTVSPSGAPADGNTGDWFTAATFADWADGGDLDAMAVHVLVTVDGPTVTARTVSLADGVVDEFEL